MISTTALRMASRRAAVNAVRFSSSSTFQQASASANSNANRNKALFATTAGLVAAVAVLQQQESNKTQNLFGKTTANAVKDVEEKFGTYWPRNIMILL